MSQENVHKSSKSDYLILPLIIALAYYLVFIPHQNYSFLVHLDEWLQLAGSNQIIKQAAIVGLSSPYDGGAPTVNQLAEPGSQLFWAVYHQVSGINWLDIYKYFPGIIFVITVLSVYILAQKKGFGLEAAFFTCLIPTTIGILGPGFLVPLAIALLFIPLSLFLVFNFKTRSCYLVLLIFISFLSAAHPVTTLALAIILIPFILLNIKGNFWHSLRILLIIAIPSLVTFFLIPNALHIVKTLLNPKDLNQLVLIPRIISTYGYIPVSLNILGFFLLARIGGKWNYSMILGLLALQLMLAAYFTIHYGIEILYYRGLIHMMLLMGITAGAGLRWVRSLKLEASFSAQLKTPFITRNVGNILCLILIILTLIIAIPSRQNTPYYHMIDEDDYQTFIWIKDNIDSSYDKAILDPWKGAAFTAITGRKVYSFITVSPSSTDTEAYLFLQDGSKDSSFLRKNGISIVYTQLGIENSDLTELRKNVYLFRGP